jgi:Cu2+-exporting ATPase
MKKWPTHMPVTRCRKPTRVTAAYNLVAIPVAAGLLVRWGVDLPMSVGAVAMGLSTIMVAANAHLLRRLKLQRTSL